MNKIIIVLVLSWSLSAQAESAQDMLSACTRISKLNITGKAFKLQKTFENGFCWDSMSVIQEITTYTENGKRLLRICTPKNSTRIQIVKIFSKYAQNNPQRLHEDYIPIVIESLQKVFPCEPIENK